VSDFRQQLADLYTMALDRQWLDGQICCLAVQARGSGASWQEIADALGITKQTAWERFRDHDPGRSHAHRVRLT